MENNNYLRNKEAYKLQSIVAYYLSIENLQKPEETILNLLKLELNGMKMLDIGVGGGRTTISFAELVKEYIGIDYSEKMIEACKNKFIDKSNVVFHVCDARNMAIFQDECFDFILFSFNGIDSISHEDRIKALNEIKRVLKSEKYFCFSTHNVQSIRNLFKFNFSFNFNKLRLSIKKFIKLRLINKQYKKLHMKNYAIFNDGALNYKLQMYYIKPIFQIEQLNNLGFKNIRIFSLHDGNQIVNNLENREDPWLYYLCEKA